MSSPAFFHGGMSPHTMDASQDYFESTDNSGVEKRLMRVKVLYTIGDTNNNMLARLQNTTSVPVVTTEDGTKIGVVQLQTCMQAIMSHSPELMPNLEQDFTVYAYDYSEYDTPLVGQGLLSRVLASSSPTPNAAATQSGTMITGRVCKNMLAMLSNNVTDTLEVKLKLVVVPIKHRNEYDKAMDTYRASSRGNFDVMDFDINMNMNMNSNTNPNSNMTSNINMNMNNGSFHLPANFDLTSMDSFGSQQYQNPVERANSGIDSLHDMLTPGFTGNTFDGNQSHAHSIAGSSRAGTPVNMILQNAHVAAYDGSRPSSRNSNRSTQLEQSVEDQLEQGPARKRAKVTQSEWRGRPSFGKPSDSLRVTASTTASIRDFRPSIMDMPSADANTGPRAPTPRPAGKRLQPTKMPQRRSNLRRNSSISDYPTPGPPSDASVFDDAMSSPDFPSSPPTYERNDIYRPQAPSSPGLPEISLMNDSGFQSDVPTDVPTDVPCEPEQSIAAAEKRPQGRRKRRAKASWSEYEPVDAVPHAAVPVTSIDDISRERALNAVGIGKNPARKKAATSPAYENCDTAQAVIAQTLSRPHGRPQKSSEAKVSRPVAALQRSQSLQQTVVAGKHTSNDTSLPPARPIVPPTLAPSPSMTNGPGGSPLPVTEASDTISGPVSVGVTMPKKDSHGNRGRRNDIHALKATKSLERSNTWAGPQSDVDVESATDSAIQALQAVQEVVVKKGRISSAVVRSETIKKQLKRSIDNGAPPAFCNTCGAIETPTWRPYYVCHEKGDMRGVVLTDKIHCVVPFKLDEHGITSEYIVFKKWSSLTLDERDIYQKMNFCNPCGDYFRKHKKFRPQEFWDKALVDKSKGSGRNRKRVRKSVAPSSDAPAGPMSDAVLPLVSQGQEISIPASNPQVMGPPQIPPIAEEAANQEQPSRNQSPGRQSAADKDSPDDAADRVTPKPVQRLLFPSPRKAGEFKSLDASIASSPVESEGATPKGISQGEGEENLIEEADKENLPPSHNHDHGFADLFGTTPFASPRTARIMAKNLRTPTSSRRSRNALGDRSGGDANQANSGPPVTPSRAPKASPVSGLTPFYKDLLERFQGSSSPSQGQVDLQNFFDHASETNDRHEPFNFDLKNVFGSPSGEFYHNFLSSEAMLPSDMPIPSSPPVVGHSLMGHLDNLIEFYEDATATIGPEKQAALPPSEAPTEHS